MVTIVERTASYRELLSIDIHHLAAHLSGWGHGAAPRHRASETSVVMASSWLGSTCLYRHVTPPHAARAGI